MSSCDEHSTNPSASDRSRYSAFQNELIDGLPSSISLALAVLLIAVLVVLPSIVLDGVVVSSILTPAGQI